MNNENENESFYKDEAGDAEYGFKNEPENDFDFYEELNAEATTNPDDLNSAFPEAVLEEENTVVEADTTRKKKRTWKLLAVVLMCVSLFFGAALGTALPQILNQIFNGNSNVTIVHNRTSGAKETAAKKDNENGKVLSTQEIAATVGPAVVGIENIGSARYGAYSGEVALGSGSGVIMSKDGYIVTNYHVIEGATKANAILSNGETYEAKIVGADEASDLAVLKINASDLPYVAFGDSATVMVGDKAIAIGNPLGTELMGTVTQGIISAVNRTVQVDDRTMTLLQTDAAINSGNSGGALINAYGEVIGINNAKMAANGVEGLGFAIPSNTVVEVVNELIDYGYVRGRTVIGIGGSNVTEKMATYYDLPVGFYVQEVYDGTGADMAGIKPGDVIVQCDGQMVRTIDDINAIKKQHKVGETITMGIVRNGKKINVHVVLQEEKPDTAW